MIEAERDGSVLTLRIARPEKANSLTREMLLTLEQAVADAEDAGVAALVLTGTGRTFSAGADLQEARAGLATDPVWERLSGAIAGLPCLTVAALNGTLAGGAFGMALACDLRVSVPEARFFYPAIGLGFLPQPSDPRRMAALIGPARSKLLLMAGRRIDAETALAWGLVDLLEPAEGFPEALAALTQAACTAPPEIRAGIKALIPAP